MNGTELERKCKNLTFDESHDFLGIISRVKPPIVDCDQKFVAPPVSPTARLASGGGLDPAEMTGAGILVVLEFELILNLMARSLVPLDPQGTGKGYAVVLYQMLHS
jgi:hypothetical protein